MEMTESLSSCWFFIDTVRVQEKYKFMQNMFITI